MLRSDLYYYFCKKVSFQPQTFILQVTLQTRKTLKEKDETKLKYSACLDRFANDAKKFTSTLTKGCVVDVVVDVVVALNRAKLRYTVL